MPTTRSLTHPRRVRRATLELMTASPPRRRLASVTGPSTDWRWILAVLGSLAVISFFLPRPVPGAAFFTATQAASLAVLVLVMWRRTPYEITAWRIITAGLLIVGGGLVPVSLGSVPYQDLATSPVRAVGYAIVVFGGLRLIHGPEPDHARSVTLEALAVANGAGLVAWFALVQPQVELGLVDSWLDALIAAAIPSVDVALVVLAVQVAWTQRGLARYQWLIVAAVAANTITDLGAFLGFTAVGYPAGGVTELGLVVVLPLLAAAAAHPSSRVPLPIRRRNGWAPIVRVRRAALLTSLMIVPGVLVVHGLTSAGPADALGRPWWVAGPPVEVHLAMGAVAAGLLVAFRLFGSLDQLERVIQARDALEHDLKRQAQSDALTLLPNRAAFAARLERTILTFGPGRVAVLFCDLDDFKVVNDQYGHAAGDELLAAVALRLQGAVRPTDMVARLGGDEFAVLLPDLPNPGVAEATATRVLDAFASPFGVAATTMQVRLSIGLAMVAAGMDASAVIRAADIAMYAAKTSGKGHVEIFDDRLQAIASERDAILTDLAMALPREQLRLDYQPIWSIDGRRLMGVEALLRWDHPVRGTLLPEDFLPQAEQTGLIVPIGRWVLLSACRQMRQWLDAGAPSTSHMSVNISALQLVQPRFVTEVEACLAATSLRPANLLLELTESAFVDAEAAVLVLDALKKVGVRLAVDDFGTGYSSMSYLANLPIDVLKIDRSFVAVMNQSTQGRAMVRTIIRLARDLGLETVAEGIEDPAQLRALRDLGCRLGQGFLVGRPAGAASIGILMTALPGMDYAPPPAATHVPPDDPAGLVVAAGRG